MKEPVSRTHATLLLERSPPTHGGYAIALKLFKDFWSYFRVTLLLSSQPLLCVRAACPRQTLRERGIQNSKLLLQTF
ncbi:hypothetical protein H6G97_45145 [Nostoc flagelliforme FACHB-838]|uniref:Uncharacterized protein n=1 Tax=Nostoc flagelliforme FACHB-838 TaxID=2692904 RepID=A0ABR8E337_9NOSO|nr:hypothetical protein [Nostoc flagelliforme]MBD2536124.1 hypothetical protein [Nostoc flagelliforme FACHB-838]